MGIGGGQIAVIDGPSLFMRFVDSITS